MTRLAPARPSASRRVRRRRTLTVLGVLVVVPVLVLVAGGGWFWWQLDPPGGPGDPVEVVIQRGWGVGEIGEQLQQDGVIGSAFVFKAYAQAKSDTSFEAGTYDMREDLGVRGAVNALKAGPRIDYNVLTEPPGLWLTQIAARVAEQIPGMNADTFLQAARNNSVRSPYQPDDVNTLEGLLFPDTYNIAAGDDERKVVQILSDTFVAKANALGLADAEVRGYGPYDIIKIASMIEAEAKVPEDRAKIASVIYNRLAAGMPLQIDATLIYARGDPANRSLSNADKQIDSPYNTYANKGLPPTPIASVTEASLRAALNPDETDYLYYVVSDTDGRHAFATTLRDHERNIAAARQAGVLP